MTAIRLAPQEGQKPRLLHARATRSSRPQRLQWSGAYSPSLLGFVLPPVGVRSFVAAVAGVGDLDGDGSGDVLIGAPRASSAGADAGSVAVWSLAC